MLNGPMELPWMWVTTVSTGWMQRPPISKPLGWMVQTDRYSISHDRIIFSSEITLADPLNMGKLALKKLFFLDSIRIFYYRQPIKNEFTVKVSNDTTTLNCVIEGSFCFQIVLREAVQHPFSIAVFEDMLYWSDWENLQIENCNKFTGKNHTWLLKEQRSREDKHKHSIYGASFF